jgi:hypothetical protein
MTGPSQTHPCTIPLLPEELLGRDHRVTEPEVTSCGSLTLT